MVDKQLDVAMLAYLLALLGSVLAEQRFYIFRINTMIDFKEAITKEHTNILATLVALHSRPVGHSLCLSLVHPFLIINQNHQVHSGA